ncbi:hypothetical protein F4775DRAFT_240906 [Biscogniauxia sp. FL1348]|nr:hypothetical protein F4775DRAFT_240906 [Biscogniauxia sp. FL1348]
MYSPYGSYSSMSSVTQPLDIGSGSYLSRNNSTYHANCAFPSWPQRSSLTDHEEERATSYLSDDDLFPCDPLEDDAHSISSAGSTAPTSPAMINADELMHMQQQKMALEREALKQILNERDRRRQQQQYMQQQSSKRHRRSSGGSRKSSKSNKHGEMTPITEAGE